MPSDFKNLVLNEMPDAVMVMTPKGNVVHWTKGAERVFGYADAEVVGRSAIELLVPGERIEEECRRIQTALTAGACNYESIRHTKEGALVYVDISSKAIYDENGAVEYILTSQKDVTSLKVLRDAKFLEAKFRDLLESMPDGIVMSNATGHIVLANSQAENLFAYSPGELRGKSVEALLPPRFRRSHVTHRTSYAIQPHARTMGAGLELFGLRKDGQEFPVEISLSPLETEEGALVMSAVRDISGRKQIERTLHEKNLELENANRAKDRFLASMSHELRTPLNAIIGFTGTLLMRLPGPLTSDQEKQLGTIQHSAKHLLSLINDLLDVATIEAGKLPLHPETVNCQSLVLQVTDTLLPIASQKGLRLRSEVPDNPIDITTDQRAIKQILINLANNAIKFTEHGEVVIVLARRVEEKRQLVDITVRDTGAGIRDEDQPKLFQAFTQIDSSSTRRFEGTGLGLYLSQKLADLIGGQLSFRSKFGEGSSFTFTLEGDKP